jgi:BirA family biotin operon repressor/biotin-[acetyl-CoA-carboxylase] ligase
LIENSLKSDGASSSVGLGLNINQTNFDNLPKSIIISRDLRS